MSPFSVFDLSKAFWSLLVALIILSGCGEARHDPGSGFSKGGFGKLEGSFQSIFNNIIQPKCVRCHSGDDTPHGIDLSSYEKIMNNSLFPPLIVANKPYESSLFKSVLFGKMPKEGRRLSENELNVIYDWILSGAKKNPSDGVGDNDEPCDDDDEPCD